MLGNSLHIIYLFTFIYLLSAFRKLIVYELQGISILLTGSHKPGGILYTIITFPGTVIHELSHWLTAEILRVPTGEISLFPSLKEFEKQEQRLGSVAVAKTDPFRGFLIGTAPLFTGTALLVGISLLLNQAWDQRASVYHLVGLIYAVIVLGNSMLVSRSDRRYWPFMALLTLALYFTFSRTGLSIPQEFSDLLTSSLKSINNALMITIIAELVLIILFFLLRITFQKIRGKKIRRY